MGDELLTVEDVARYLKMEEVWVYRQLKTKSGSRLPGFKLGKYWRFRREDILEWLERQKSNN